MQYEHLCVFPSSFSFISATSAVVRSSSAIAHTTPSLACVCLVLFAAPLSSPIAFPHLIWTFLFLSFFSSLLFRDSGPHSPLMEFRHPDDENTPVVIHQPAPEQFPFTAFRTFVFVFLFASLWQSNLTTLRFIQFCFFFSFPPFPAFFESIFGCFHHPPCPLHLLRPVCPSVQPTHCFPTHAHTTTTTHCYFACISFLLPACLIFCF